MAKGLATWSKEANVNSVIFLYKTHPYYTPLLEKNKGKKPIFGQLERRFFELCSIIFLPVLGYLPMFWVSIWSKLLNFCVRQQPILDVI